jgi:hypothetical protein
MTQQYCSDLTLDQYLNAPPNTKCALLTSTSYCYNLTFEQIQNAPLHTKCAVMKSTDRCPSDWKKHGHVCSKPNPIFHRNN